MTSLVVDAPKVERPPSARPDGLRVASVPAGHVYVRHLDSPEHPLVTRLADPRPRPGAASGQWWPPAMLDPRWIEQHAPGFDLLHLHFGFDAVGPEDLAAVLATLRRLGKAFVYTVHDLRNPHHAAGGAHDAALDILVPQADSLITLTPGAAEVISARWGRSAHVVPHPHVLPLSRISPRPGRGGEFVVGVHAKSARASMQPLAVLQALLPLVDELPGLRVRFDVHRDVFERSGRRHDPVLAAFVATAAESGEVDLRVHEFFTDEELWEYLGGLDLSVLPYRFGTHSGWLEACFDLGTTVLAPSCGFYHQQRQVLSYQHDESGLDADSLRRSVRQAYHDRPVWQPERRDRESEREQIATSHRAIYSGVVR